MAINSLVLFTAMCSLKQDGVGRSLQNPVQAGGMDVCITVMQGSFKQTHGGWRIVIF